MKFSFTLFGLDPRFYGPLAQRAEQRGFEAVWFADHLITPIHFDTPYPYDKTGIPPFNPATYMHDVWVSIANVAAVTSKIKFGTGVFVVPLRRPVPTAYSIATAHHLSNGRVMLGVGSGWLAEEFAVADEPFKARGERMDEILDIYEKLWSGKPVAHEGKWYQFEAVQFGLPAVTPIPILIGGMTTVAFQRAARRGDGWYAMPAPLEDLVRIRATMDEMRTIAGRQDRPFAHYVALAATISGENIRRYEDNGFEHLRLGLLPGPRPRAEMSLQEHLDVVSQTADLLAKAGYPMT